MSSSTPSAETPWYREGLRFACTGCGACCKGAGYVWVDAADIVRLAAHLDIAVDTFGRRYLRRVGQRYSLIDGADEACIFWSNGCSVYEARPRQCRTFPFWPENLESETAWEETSRESPGVNAGHLYTIDEIERLLAGEGAADGTQSRGRSRAEEERGQ